MLKTPFLPERARQQGLSDDITQRLKDEVLFRRRFLEDVMLVQAGEKIQHWSAMSAAMSDVGIGTKARTPFPDLNLQRYSFSDHKAAINAGISYLLAKLSWFAIWNTYRLLTSSRLETARLFYRESVTRSQMLVLIPVVLLCEVVMPLLWVLVILAVLLARVVVQTGIRVPLLSFFHFMVSGSGLNGEETLPPGENGYTRVFQGGEDVNLVDLEKELMKTNSRPRENDSNLNTVCISYKHYANKGIVPGDDHRICRTDLRAIASLIKASAPCNLRFWIDSKLPPTDDATFERWLNRGVRPYGRYITFICPSAQQHADTSFWLSNEFHFATAAKGALYCSGDQIYYEHRYGYQLDLHRRFLHVLTSAERHPVHVRDEDSGKVVQWAMCCMRAEERGLNGSLSPNIDSLTMVGELPRDHVLLSNITRVIRKFGAQELPVIPGRSWNKDNPLLLGGLRDQKFDLSHWYGLCLDDSPCMLFFVHEKCLLHVQYDTVVALEITLDKPRFSEGKICIVRKILREVKSDVIIRCKFVTLPWLCDWD